MSSRIANLFLTPSREFATFQAFPLAENDRFASMETVSLDAFKHDEFSSKAMFQSAKREDTARNKTFSDGIIDMRTAIKQCNESELNVN